MRSRVSSLKVYKKDILSNHFHSCSKPSVECFPKKMAPKFKSV